MARATEARVNGARSSELAEEDVGNIIGLEHVNVTIPDQLTATTFYVLGLGLTRDPYMNVGLNNMWINVGEQQFHLPTRAAQVIPGHVGLVVPSLEALERRLKTVQEALASTRFAWTAHPDHMAVTCPWGNQFRCYAPGPHFGDLLVGIKYVELLAPRGSAAAIVRFYERVMRALARVERNGAGTAAHVRIGTHQELVFRESDADVGPYAGHHVAIYIANFSGPFADLEAGDRLTRGLLNHQFNFKDIYDPKTGESVFTLEHEVRGLRHPQYRRFMVNRNADQSQGAYVRGHDALIPFKA